jgi:hypothetical protein
LSRLAESGRWVAASYLAVQGVYGFYAIIAALPGAWAHSDTLSYPVDYFGLGFSVLFAICAWGLFRWRKWAHATAATLCLFEIVSFGVQMVIYWPFSVPFALGDFRIALLPLIDIPVLTWLLLPDVRAAYWRPEVACAR